MAPGGGETAVPGQHRLTDAEKIAFLSSEVQRLREDRNEWRQMAIELLALHPSVPPSQGRTAEAERPERDDC